MTRAVAPRPSPAGIEEPEAASEGDLEQIIGVPDVGVALVPNDAPALPSYESCPMTGELFHRQMHDALGGTRPPGLYCDLALLTYCLANLYALPGRYDPKAPGPRSGFGPGRGP